MTKRKYQLAAAVAAVALGVTLGVASPAVAQPTAKVADNPSVACRLNGVDTGTLRGYRAATYATTREQFGECGTVFVRVQYYVPGGSGAYYSNWVSGSSYAHSGGFPSVPKGYHTAGRALYQVESFPS